MALDGPKKMNKLDTGLPPAGCRCCFPCRLRYCSQDELLSYKMLQLQLFALLPRAVAFQCANSSTNWLGAGARLARDQGHNRFCEGICHFHRLSLEGNAENYKQIGCCEVVTRSKVMSGFNLKPTYIGASLIVKSKFLWIHVYLDLSVH